MNIIARCSIFFSPISLYVQSFIKTKIITAQKMKFSIKDFFSKCDQMRSFLRIWAPFTEEILNGKLQSLCSEYSLDFWFNAVVN